MSNENISNSPGVFRGGCRLASAQELASLRTEIMNMISGPLNDVSENGYIPWKYKNDGSVDIESLFPDLITQFNEDTGLKITKDGVHVTDGVKSINFSGKFVALNIDENGNLVITIDQPNESIPRFNQATALSNAVVNPITDNMVDEVIIPDTSASPDYQALFGTWEPGEKHKAIVKAHNDYDYLEFDTADPVFASSKNTYFEIKVYDGFDNEKASFISKDIEKNTNGTNKLEPASLNNSNYIFIYITEFKEEQNGYSFKPYFKINLAKIFTDGGRFRIEIIHHDDVNVFKYVTPDMLYIGQSKPIISNVTYQLDTNDGSENPLNYVWSSGIKYVNRGNVIIRFKVKNLNKLASVSDKFDCNFSFTNTNIVVEDENYSDKIEDESIWKIKLPVKPGLLSVETITGRIAAKNAYDSSDVYDVQIPLLVNSLTDLEDPSPLKEPFSNESYRLMNDITSLTDWDSTQDITQYDECNGLMVIPGKGLVYPYGDWTLCLPNGSPNYSNNSYLTNEKYFVRKFTGNLDLKFGGIFVFDGITKQDFFNERISFIFSSDNGISWYSLKDIRNSSVILNRNGVPLSAQGTMTDVKEKDGKLYVTWSYPGSKCSANAIYIKFGMKSTAPYCVKSIQLLNLDGSEDW